MNAFTFSPAGNRRQIRGFLSDSLKLAQGSVWKGLGGVLTGLIVLAGMSEADAFQIPEGGYQNGDFAAETEYYLSASGDHATDGHKPPVGGTMSI